MCEPKVEGQVVDAYTRCVHYHLTLDIIAIKFKCCGTYFPCYECHTGHDIQRWPKSELDVGVPVILCGECKGELSFAQYSEGGARCCLCNAAFNPKCALHYDIYFDLES